MFRLILTRSNGNPGWCSNYLNYLIGVGKLVFDSRPLNDVQNDKEMLVILNTQVTHITKKIVQYLLNSNL